ncbi:MAG: WYL domain-containing protein [Oscillospiraceae bacterium]
MANSCFQKLKILYILDMLLKLSDEDHPIDTDEIILHLKNQGIEAERKSIYADIGILKEFGYEIMRTRSLKSGYFIADRDFQIAEVRLLSDAVQAANFISGKKTKELLKKIYALVSKYQADKLLNQVYVDNRPKCKNEEIYYTIDKLDNAIQLARQVEFIYQKRIISDENKIEYDEKVFIVNPYSLIWSSDHYYLVCNKINYDNLMVVRIDRIKKVKILENKKSRHFSQVSQYQTSFDAADYANKHFNMFSGEPKPVELAFQNSLIDDVLDRFGENVKIKRFGDSKFLLEANLAISPGLVSWVMQYGGDIEVKKPNELKQMVLKKVDEIRSVYTI